MRGGDDYSCVCCPESRAKRVEKSLRRAPSPLPIAIQAVYSLQIIVPVVQRTEQGFPKGKARFSHEFAKLINSAQTTAFKRVE